MGFRCPKCKQEFGLNQDEFTRHLLTNPICALSSSAILLQIQEIMKKIDSDENN